MSSTHLVHENIDPTLASHCKESDTESQSVARSDWADQGHEKMSISSCAAKLGKATKPRLNAAHSQSQAQDLLHSEAKGQRQGHKAQGLMHHRAWGQKKTKATRRRPDASQNQGLPQQRAKATGHKAKAWYTTKPKPGQGHKAQA